MRNRVWRADILRGAQVQIGREVEDWKRQGKGAQNKAGLGKHNQEFEGISPVRLDNADPRSNG